MKEITAAQAASYAQLPLFCGPEENRAVSAERDSRRTGEKSIFFALPGTKNDGNDFAPAAYENGCRIFVLSSESMAERMRTEYSDASVILADDALQAMQRMAKNYLADLDMIRIAVTGSVGKTSTKEMLYRIFSPHFRTICSQENFNNHIGVPLTVFLADEKTQVGIFEMGMNHSGEIRLLADIVRPQKAVITNVGTSHIGNLGSRDNIMKAKMEIADFMDSSSVLIYNADNDKLSALSSEESIYRKIAVGSRAQSAERTAGGQAQGRPERELLLSDITDENGEAVRFSLTCGEDRQNFFLPLPGIHNAHNAALAAACGLACGISLSQSAESLAAMTNSTGRLLFERHGEISILNDTYNASPDSVRAAVDVLLGKKAQRRVALLADMNELGEDSAQYHFSTGRYAAEQGIDLLITVGEKAKKIAEGAGERMKKEHIFSFDSSQQFCRHARELIRPGDLILIKGSHSTGMDRVARYLAEAAETGEWDGH